MKEVFWIYEITAGEGVYQGVTGPEAEKVARLVAGTTPGAGEPFAVVRERAEKTPPEPEMIAFNTDRSYSRNGQRIAAEIVADGGLLFVDVDRNINGYVSAVTMNTQAAMLSRYWVMFLYDHGFYVDASGFDERVAALKVRAKGVPPTCNL